MRPVSLVIGYGNELRSDDGVGPSTARAVGKLPVEGVQVLEAHQLTPELAEPIAKADRVIFIDATLAGSPGEVTVQPLAPADLTGPMGHLSRPDQLLALAKAVFGHAPTAWLVTITVQSLELGEKLTLPAQRGAEAAVDAIRRLLQSTTSAIPPGRA